MWAVQIVSFVRWNGSLSADSLKMMKLKQEEKLNDFITGIYIFPSRNGIITVFGIAVSQSVTQRNISETDVILQLHLFDNWGLRAVSEETWYKWSTIKKTEKKHNDDYRIRSSSRVINVWRYKFSLQVNIERIYISVSSATPDAAALLTWVSFHSHTSLRS